MLQLQRASAGSGKTFTLAKKFIWFFITIRPEGEKRRLRTPAELDDSLRHILAVTFTNKATNEMQMRIVEKLFALGYPDEAKARGIKRDYAAEFCRELGVSEEQLAATCRRALSILLHGYSDFNVSTIDSFFQQVLRTFAYETGINDSYQVELDTDYLTRLAVNALLEQLDTKRADPSILFWIRVLMRREKRAWNIFQRKERQPGHKSGSPYSDLLEAVAKLENEDYKTVRPKIEAFFSGESDLRKEYERLSDYFASRLKEPRKGLLKKADDFMRALPPDVAGATGNSTLAVFPRMVRFILGSPDDRLPSAEIPDYTKILAKPAYLKYVKAHPGEAALLEAGAAALLAVWEDWTRIVGDPAYRSWRLYEANLPFMGLFSIILEKRREFLEENNALELAETSSILHEMIGDDDAPFVYERMGTYLNHFLIDEFQDTSRLQWANLRPLVSESMSRDNDNLIIGDAKQSIYRFRNADPSLITDVVPREFEGRVDRLGDAPEHNTNWRSRLQVVRFNNTFFRFLARGLDSIFLPGAPARLSFDRLYSNVVQPPHHQENAGYVEATVYDASDKEFQLTEQIPGMIRDMLSRGYRLNEIAVLVDTSSQASKVIADIMAHNAALAVGERPISFISEQSLLVKASPAVAIVVACLESVARGAAPRLAAKDEPEGRRTHFNWRELECNFRFFMMSHPEVVTEELMRRFLEEGAQFDALRDMLAGMQSVALPALVEAIVARFVDADLRARDAIYIAAFQDLVLEYCEGHSTDIASFLEWWGRKSTKASISSPEETDALRIMTIHKSKGLEFRCVIIPFADWQLHDTLSSKGTEWRWVKPLLPEELGAQLPEYLPVAVSREMEGTPHVDSLHKYYDQYKLDNVNRAYVGFTRAKDELYIFAPRPRVPKKATAASAGDMLLGSFLDAFAREVETLQPGGDMPEALVHGEDVAVEESAEGRLTIRIGHKPEQVEEERKVSSAIELGDYPSLTPGDYLRYRIDTIPLFEGEGESDEEEGNGEENEATAHVEDEEADPRSEGSIRHAILENVVTVEDLPRAVRQIRMAGLLSAMRQREVLTSLQESLADPRVARWFDGSGRVVAERSILKAHGPLRRPDRIVIYDDESAEVIDYKFGRHMRGSYSLQVKRYVDALKDTGEFCAVRGYLWYVNLGEIIHVAD